MNRRKFLSTGLKAAVIAPVAGVAAVMLSNSRAIPLCGHHEIDGIALLRYNQIVTQKPLNFCRAVMPGDEIVANWDVE